jgi:hypothetical protein
MNVDVDGDKVHWTTRIECNRVFEFYLFRHLFELSEHVSDQVKS